MARSLLLPGDRPWLHALLFVATLTSTFFVSLVAWTQDVAGAAAFSASVVGILGTHEMGHYLLARRHGVDTTLPYFIPVPFGFGTMGAVIRIRSRIPTRNALVDIGAAGPLAGLAVAIPVLWWGLSLSRVAEAPAALAAGAFPGDLSAIGIAQRLLEGGTFFNLPDVGAPVRMYTVFGDSLLMQGLTFLVFGPLPEGTDVFVHPMVTAGWFGLLVTMLNLCPIGQLDGGHLTHAWFGRHAVALGKLAALGLLFLVLFFSVFWLLWLIVTALVIGFRHPPVEFPAEPLSLGRRVVCLLSFAALIGCIVPIPLQQVFAP